jgi:hypothetical protein
MDGMGKIYWYNYECGEWKTLRVSASIYNPTGGAAMARWISIGI